MDGGKPYYGDMTGRGEAESTYAWARLGVSLLLMTIGSVGHVRRWRSP